MTGIEPIEKQCETTTISCNGFCACHAAVPLPTLSSELINCSNKNTKTKHHHLRVIPELFHHVVSHHCPGVVCVTHSQEAGPLRSDQYTYSLGCNMCSPHDNLKAVLPRHRELNLNLTWEESWSWSWSNLTLSNSVTHNNDSCTICNFCHLCQRRWRWLSLCWHLFVCLFVHLVN